MIDPAPAPEGILDPKKPYWSADRVGEATWLRLKGKLTGRKIPELSGEQHTSYVKLSDADADRVIENVKKWGKYPQINENDKYGGAYNNEAYQKWLVEEFLEKPFREQTNKKIEEAEVEKRLEEIQFEKKLKRKVNHPKLYPELQYIKPRYMWGQNGLYDLDFKSDIDRAIYFTGKLDSNSKGSQDKIAVREWLFLVTGLDVYEDYEEVKKYRTNILELILKLVKKLTPSQREITVPPVYTGYYQEPEEPEEEEVENDDLYGQNLDNLLGEIRSEPSNEALEQEEEKELQEQVNVAVDTLDQAEEAKQEVINEEVLEDLPDSIKEDLQKILNRRKNNSSEKQNSSSYVSNAKIYNFLVKNLTQIQKTFESIDKSIQKQNQILSANFASTSSMLQSIESQDSMLINQIDALANEYRKQNEIEKALLDEQENITAESNLEKTKDAAGTEGFKDTRGNGGLINNLIRFFGKRLARWLWKRLPRKWRAAARLGRIAAKKFGSKILAKIPGSKVVKTAITNPKVAAKFLSKTPVGNLAGGISRPVAGAVGSADRVTRGAGQDVLQRALKSPAIQKALVGKIGKEGAEKLTVKIAAKLVPGISTAYGLGEGLARIAMGDVKGGFLSFGSAIPVAGWGFAAIDILRDIDVAAYTKNIEPNLPAPKDEHFAAFFSEALGVGSDQYEIGTESTKPGTAILHGTELVVNKNNKDNQELYNQESTIARTLLGATVGFLNQSGPAAASITPVIKQLASPLIKKYGKPNILVQSDSGGTIPSLKEIINKRKTKTPEEELSEMERSLLEEQNPEKFSEKLLKMLDPGGRFQQLLEQIKSGNPNPGPDQYDGTVVAGDLKGNIVNPMEEGDMQDYPGAKFGAPRMGRTGKMDRKHLGRDIVGPAGMKFSAALPGTVSAIIEVADLPGGGVSKGVYVKHDNGMETRYLHVIPSVKVGDKVKAGQKLGVLTEKDSISTVAHLHFEVIVNGQHVDPEPLLKGSLKLKDIAAGKVPGLTIENYDGTAPPPPGAAPKVISSTKINDKTFTEREGGRYFMDGKEVTKNVYDKEKEKAEMVEDVMGPSSIQVQPDQKNPVQLGLDALSNLIPGRENGGSIKKGKTYLTGEKGPELISTDTDGFVFDAEKTRQIAGLFSNFFKGTGSSLQEHPYMKQVELERVKKQMNLPPGKGFTGQYDMFGRPTGYGAMLDKKNSNPEKNTSEIATYLKQDQNYSGGQIMIINQQPPAQVAMAKMSGGVQQIHQNYYESNSTLANIVMQRLVG